MKTILEKPKRLILNCEGCGKTCIHYLQANGKYKPGETHECNPTVIDRILGRDENDA